VIGSRGNPPAESRLGPSLAKAMAARGGGRGWSAAWDPAAGDPERNTRLYYLVDIYIYAPCINRFK